MKENKVDMAEFKEFSEKKVMSKKTERKSLIMKNEEYEILLSKNNNLNNKSKK